jgi:hypothetical protein
MKPSKTTIEVRIPIPCRSTLDASNWVNLGADHSDIILSKLPKGLVLDQQRKNECTFGRGLIRPPENVSHGNQVFTARMFDQPVVPVLPGFVEFSAAS